MTHDQSVLTKTHVPSSSINTQMTHLLSLAGTTNPSSGTDWFVLSPFLGGPNSAVTRFGQEADQSSAFAHRDLRVVWELYAKALGEDGLDMAVDADLPEDASDLVEVVDAMSAPLQPVQTVCTWSRFAAIWYRSECTSADRIQILHMSIRPLRPRNIPASSGATPTPVCKSSKGDMIPTTSFVTPRACDRRWNARDRRAGGDTRD